MKEIFKLLVVTILFISIVLPDANLFAQKKKIKFERFSLEEGLSVSSIVSIVQDSKGFLWIATEDGLNRYDGYNFKIFRNIPEDPTSLCNNRLWSIMEDSKGDIWIGTNGGLEKFDREKEQFVHYKHDPTDATSLGGNAVSAICEDKSGVLWIGTLSAGLSRFDREKDLFTNYRHDPKDSTSLSNDELRSIYVDKNNVLWIGTSGGLNKYDREKKQFTHYTYNSNDPSSLSDNNIRSIYEDNSGVLWIGTWAGGLNKLVPGDKENSRPSFIHYKHDPNEPASLSKNGVASIFQDKLGNLWIGTDGNGLDKLIPGNNSDSTPKFIHYKYDPSDPTSLSNNRVLSIYEDNSGLLWIGTREGLNKIDLQKEQFGHYKHNPGDPTSLSNDRVFSFLEDDSGIIWIGTNGGLNKFDRVKNQFTHYTPDPNDPASLNDNRTWPLYEDDSGKLWLGTYVGGLNIFDKETEKFTHYMNDPNNPNSISNNTVLSIYEDNSSVVWIGTDGGGLNKFVPGDGKGSSPTFIHYKHDPDIPASLSDNRFITVYGDKSGVIWVGTWSGGLNKLVPGKDKDSPPSFVHYKHDPDDPTSLSNNSVWVIYEDSAEILWIGTNGGGLNKFDREIEQFKHYRQADGLPNDVIYGILEDDYGNLWISTNKGLSKFNPRTESFKNYDVEDGLQSNEFNVPANYKTKSGEMFFGGINGFNVFHPDSIKDNSYIPPVVLTDFQLFNVSVPIGIDTTINRSILKKSITETAEIELTHEDHIFSFEFASLDFHTPDKNIYAFFMEGFDKDWRFTDASRRFVTYTNLDPGEYTFKVKGTNNDGVWNEQGTSIKIIIIPPWWATWWAYTLYGLIGISFLYSLRRYELNRVQWKNQAKLDEVKLKERDETDKMKSRFFANISHEFRTPLTLILGPSENIITKTSENETKNQAGLIKKNASRLLDLINQLLDLSKLEAGKLRLETSLSNIVPFVKGITMSFESLAERRNITLKVEPMNEDINIYFDIEKMAKIITNLLSNAFKFTPEGGKITVLINEADVNSLEIIIRDTGIGISEEEIPRLFNRFYQVDSSQTKEYEGTGIGLALTKELIELHKGSINVESKEGLWTEFTIVLPLGRGHLKDEEIIQEKEIQDNVILSEAKNLSEINIVDSSSSFDPAIAGQASQNDSKMGEEKNILLVVEDNADVRKYIKDSLGVEYQVEEAVNGEEGVSKAEMIIPDLIISDVMMPKMDGNELTRILKNDEKTSHIPIILLTAKAEQESKLEGLETGADAYLTKPFDTKELHVRIKNLLNIRRKLQEKYSKGVFVQKENRKKLSDLDSKFMNKVMDVIENHLSEEDFSIEEFDKELGMGRVQIFRKLKALTGRSPSRYIRSIRLVNAKKMIEEKKGNISEIAYSVGFGSPAYFTKCFKEEFGFSPSNLTN